MLVAVVSAIFYSASWTFAAAESDKSNDKWLIYWYISGNNLEWKDGSATEDLQEISRVEFNDSNIDINGEQGEVTFIIPNKDGENKEQPVTIKTIQFFPKSKLLRTNIEGDVRLSPNVKILIQTGGCRNWRTQDIPNNAIGRYLLDSDGFHYQGSFPDANMGSADTLEDFLRYGKENIEKDFKPDHRMFIFWGHGDLLAVCLDERYEDNALDLNEIRRAFSKVYKASPDNPPFEIIGFDSCLRATYENANNIYGFARYMIASEEKESGYGWYYSDWIKKLSENPSISSKQLSKIICESSFNYLQTNEDVSDDFKSNATFSTIDLSPSKWIPLRNAYDSFMKNCYKYGVDYIYSDLKNAANNTTGYPLGNNQKLALDEKEMLDLKTFAENIKLRPTNQSLIESADNLINAIDSAVVCNIYGETRIGSNGISFYNPFRGNNEEFEMYASQNTISKHTKRLYEALFNASNRSESDNLNTDNVQETSSRSTRSSKRSQKLREMYDISDINFSDIPFDYNEDKGELYINFTPDQMRRISYISGSLSFGMFKDEDQSFVIDDANNCDKYIYLGEDTKIQSDWNSGKVTIKLPTTWTTLNGRFVYTEILESVDSKVNAEGNVIQRGYVIYGIPVEIKGTRCTLRVVYYPDNQEYKILGAKRITEGYTMPSRESIIPKKGNTITPLFMTMIKSEDNINNVTPVYSVHNDQVDAVVIWQKGKSFTIEDNLVVSRKPLKGDYTRYEFLINLYSIVSKEGLSLYPPISFSINHEGKVFDIDLDALHNALFNEGSSSIEVTDHENGSKYAFDPTTRNVTQES